MRDDLDAWLDAHWDPDLTVGAWWALLAEAGWTEPSARFAERGVLGPPGGTAVMVVLPAIIEHATAAQSPELARPILEGRAAWCLLLSEPDAGTDLAALTTAAVRDGDEWVIDGRKTWATGAHLADRALLLARTGAADSRHRGLTAFVVDLRQPGVEIRPMREMTGRALSNDVFLTDVRVPAAAVLGEVGGGWAVVQTAVTAERRSVGGHRGATARPGTAGDLDRRAGDFVGTAPRRRDDDRPSEAPAALAVRLASADPVLRQDAVRVHVAAEVARLTAAREDVPGAANIAKLWAGMIVRAAADVTARALGAAATLHAYRRPAGDDAATVTSLVLNAPSMSLVGGNDFVQRDQLAERILGLPKSP